MKQEQKRMILAFGLSLVIVLVPLIGFGAETTTPTPTPTGGIVPCSGTDCTFNSLIVLVNEIIKFLLYTVAFPISTALFAYAGILYITAAGDGGKISKAHAIFKNVFIGLVIALAGFLIVDLITNVLTGGGKAANPFG